MTNVFQPFAGQTNVHHVTDFRPAKVLFKNLVAITYSDVRLDLINNKYILQMLTTLLSSLILFYNYS